MRLSLRSYPHPVVGNRDDVQAVAFQATVEMSSDKENVYIDVAVNCSSSTIKNLTSQGTVVFVVHVECSNTLFRRAFEFSEPSKRIPIQADRLNETVEVNVFACAARDISDYRIDGAHPDYGNSAFEVKKGDILAAADGHSFYIESSFDSLSRIGSIMQIQEAREDGDVPMSIDFNGDKILVILSKQDFKDYKLLKNHESLSGPLTCTIVLPVLLEAVHLLKDGGVGSEEGGPRWARALQRRIMAVGLDSESDYLVLAQKLLELPLKRAMISARQMAEAA